ncbi:MAG: hypothetical protein EOP86_11420 [Verrucomicrobiaceae bacterium]|nr:MAG: hypothetical protein EOP86_11420 [Verrucomicrobiaceae bacterium]
MKIPLILLCFLSLTPFSQAESGVGRKGWLIPPSGSSGDTEAIRVQTTIFKVRGREIPMSLLEQPAPQDEALFLRLAAMAANGQAELVADQHFSTPHGRELRIEAMKEFPYPTEYERRGTEMLPASCEFKSLGTSLVAELYAGGRPGASGLSTGTAGRLILENIRGDQQRRVPVSLPDSPVDGVLLSPRFFTEKTTAAWISADQDHHLVSMFRAAETLHSPEEAYCFVFAKASVPSTEKPMPGLPSGWRLHALTFRISWEEGRALLDNPGNRSDAGLLASMLASAAAGGTSHPHNHAILRMDAGQLLATREPGGTRDPFAPPPASGAGEEITIPLGSQSESIEEYAYPTESDDDYTPQSFEFKNLGRSFAVTVVEPSKAGTAVVEIRLQENALVENRLWPEPDAITRSFRAYPQFSETALESTVRIAAGSVVCLGAVTLPEDMTGSDESGPGLEITFLKVTGSRAPGMELTPSPRTEYEIFSLTAEDAAALEQVRGDFSKADAFLAGALEAGTAHSLAWAMLGTGEAGKALIKARMEYSFPTHAVWTHRKWLFAHSFAHHSCGTSFLIPSGSAARNTAAGALPSERMKGMTPPRETDKEITDAEFRHDVLLRMLPDTAALTAAADSGGEGELPAVPMVTIVNRIPPSPPEGGRILSIKREIDAPPGHPEAGRWLVQVIRRR